MVESEACSDRRNTSVNTGVNSGVNTGVKNDVNTGVKNDVNTGVNTGVIGRRNQKHSGSNPIPA